LKKENAEKRKAKGKGKIETYIAVKKKITNVNVIKNVKAIKQSKGGK